MNVGALGSRDPSAVRDALVRRGMDPGRAEAAAFGLQPIAVTVDGLSPAERDGLVAAAKGAGVECVTGAGWAVLAGTAGALGGLARPGGSDLPVAIAERLGRVVRGSVDRPDAWEMARGRIGLDAPAVVGILNLTPDSFSDGGRYSTPDAALPRIEELVAAGAAMLDVGAESTRPGATERLSIDEEWCRLQPVLEPAIARWPDLPVSVDTVNAETARRALAAGAWAINDVSGLRLEPEIADVCAERGAGLILMHSRGPFAELATYDHATYGDVAAEVVGELADAVGRAQERGVDPGRVVVDPGLGFAKRPEHNYALLRDLRALGALGAPVMVGPSRKRFLGVETGRDAAARDAATAAACVTAYERGAQLFRVHDVSQTREALQIAHAVRK